MATDKVETKIKVGFYGSSDSGKTQLARGLLAEPDLKGMPRFLKDYFPTMGMSFFTATSNVKGVPLTISDVSGQERYKSVAEHAYMPMSDISVVCINSCDKASLKQAEGYIDSIQKVHGENAKIVIVLTQMDREAERAVTNEEIEDLKKRKKIVSETIETSAKNGVGIEELRAGITDIALGKDRKNLNELAATNKALLQPMITAALEPYEKTKRHKKTGDLSLFGKPTPYQALLNFQNALDKAQSFEQYAAAVQQFKRELPEDVLKVQPANVRGGLARLFDALVNWDKSYFADNPAEIAERQRVAQQTQIKDALSKVKPEADEPKSSIHLGHNNE
ncbi:Ras family protein [Legionella steelei]|uniref:Ras family protein n=1 Tax=Legionella steelei TaxID=947033 RepID=A0A0W0ZQ67_9GAMM|nr:Rab family GTPase [Legionella steelei]KTD71160.1 Ras family protein [Legionella steelei]